MCDKKYPMKYLYFFFILNDTYSQVESLTAARKASMQGNEPSDAIRVVNALLTQLDQIRKQV